MCNLNFNILRCLTFWWKCGWIVPEILVGPMNLGCCETPWWWYLGAETWRSWHLIWSVFCDLLYCNVISAFHWFLKILNLNTIFCMEIPNISGSSVCNLLHVTHLAPRIWRWILALWKVCAPTVLKHLKCITLYILYYSSDYMAVVLHNG